MDPSAPDDFEQVVAGLLRASHLMHPERMPDAVAELAGRVGVLRAVVYLVDLRQGWLRPLPGRQSHDRPNLAIDATLAGRAYRHIQVQVSETEDGRPRLWLPLLDGTERLGVLELVVERVDDQLLARYRTLASLIGLMIVSKSTYSDTYAQVRRTHRMELQAEMEWTFMPPLSFATPDVIINVALEPAYQVGGDAFDYALMDNRMHVSLFDASGHDLTAGMTAITALATCRNARRHGAGLPEIADLADQVIARQFSAGRFATAQLCDLDIATGQFYWLPCGHPPPLLIRGTKVVELAATPRPPLGIRPVAPENSARYVQQRQLQPEDRVLLYTDGVTEARDPHRKEFGLPRLVDFVNQYAGEGIPAPEALRRLTRAIVEHQHDMLADDATILQLQWRPGNLDQFLP